MRITYHPNPLCTTVELDEHDRQVFWLKIKVEELQDRLFDVHFHLRESEYFNVTTARKAADPEKYIKEDDQEKTPIDERVDKMFECYAKALLDTHVGDCTKQPCSCLKCRAEGILGVDTLAPSPGSGALHAINGAFGKTTTLQEALTYLRDHVISRQVPESWRGASQEEYEKHLPRWDAQQAEAYAYLKAYAEKYFSPKNSASSETGGV